MRKLFIAVCAAAALGLGFGVARAEEEKGEVRVFLLDKEKKPVSAEGMTATLYLEMAGGTKKTVKLEPATGEAGHHGQTLPLGDRFVMLEVKKPHGDEHGEKGEEGHGEKHGEEHEGHEAHGGKVAFFRAEIPLEAYSCPMGCVQMSEKGGKCPKCGMEMKEAPIAFDAVVVLKGKDGKSQNVKGFKYPSGEAPKTLADAIARVEAVAAAVEGKVKEKKLAEVHEAAEPLKEIGDALPGLAGAAKEKAAALGAKLKAHFDELDEAGDSGDAGKTKAALERLRGTIAEIKKLGA